MPYNEKSRENLRFINKENARELQLKGAQKKKENAEKRRMMKESLDILLTKAMKKKGKLLDIADIQNLAEAEKKNIAAQDAMAIALVQRASMGDVEAFKTIRDTVGEKPSDKVELDTSLTIESWAKNHKVKL